MMMMNSNENSTNMMIPTALCTNARDQVQEPLDLDVLCGINMAKKAVDHPGNRLLKEQIDSCLEEYNSAKTKQKKMKINRHIIHTMTEKYGARFLAKRNGVWVLMDDQGIRDTISRTLRTSAQKKAKRRSEIQQTRARLAQLGEQVPAMVTSSLLDNSQESAEVDCHVQLLVDRVHRCQLQILDRMFSSDDERDASALLPRVSLASTLKKNHSSSTSMVPLRYLVSASPPP